MKSLTRRQREILDFIGDFMEENRYSPSLEEIAEHFGLSSVATVHKHLTLLQDRGAIRRSGWNQKRAIEIVGPEPSETDSAVQLPVLGLIAAGEPIEAIADNETVTVPAQFVPRGRRTFVLKVKGNSMVEDHILDGDSVIVQESPTADNGQTVVALLDGENATLKKFYREKKHVRLQPANESMPPIIVKERDLTIQGIVVGLLRKLL